MRLVKLQPASEEAGSDTIWLNPDHVVSIQKTWPSGDVLDIVEVVVVTGTEHRVVGTVAHIYALLVDDEKLADKVAAKPKSKRSWEELGGVGSPSAGEGIGES